jgi:hypothetical protein
MLRIHRSKKTSVQLNLLIAVFVFATPAASSAIAQCKCATFTVHATLEEVKGGELVEFEARGSANKFKWTVSEGTIVAGQGTEKISVQTTEEMGKRRPPQNPNQPPFFSSGQRTGTRITAVAEPILSSCKCPPQSASVRVGGRTVPINTFADVTDLRLSNDNLVLGCQPGYKPREGSLPPTSMIIDVATSAFDKENDVITYDYKITGGRIIGTGPKVKWDLADAQPGTYTITAGVDDGCGICGATKTLTITVADGCEGCGYVECPTIDISGPPHIKVGTISEFIAHVSGGSQQSVTYNWSVVNGEIVGGQGTPLIKIRAANNLDPGTGRGSVSVTLKIGGPNPQAMCPDSVTKDFLEEEKRPMDRRRSRLDTLSNNQ